MQIFSALSIDYMQIGLYIPGKCYLHTDPNKQLTSCVMCLKINYLRAYYQVRTAARDASIVFATICNRSQELSSLTGFHYALQWERSFLGPSCTLESKNSPSFRTELRSNAK